MEMKNGLKFLLVIAILCQTLATKADHLSARLLFSARINANQVVSDSSVNSIGSGVLGMMLTENQDTLYVSFSAASLSGDIQAVHIHEGAIGSNGPVVIDLTSNLYKNIARVAIPMNGDLKLKKLVEGGYYIAVHTALYPNGEIRGQIKLETDLSPFAIMNGTQVQPPVATTAKAFTVVNLGSAGDKLKFNIISSGLSGPIRTAGLYKALAGKNGSLVADLSNFILADNRVSGTIQLPDSLKGASILALLATRSLYVSLNTDIYPEGEVRGQVVLNKSFQFDSKLDTSSIVGNLSSTSNANGVAKVSINASGDTLDFHVLVNGLTGPITAAHFHNGAAGANGPVVLDLSTFVFGDQISGKLTKSNGLTTDLIKQFMYGDIYIAVHTQANTNGELRGQILRGAREGFIFDIDGNKSRPVPAVVSRGLGSGIASYDRDRTNLHVMLAVDGLSGAIKAAHFHKAVKDSTGPVLYDFSDKLSNNAAFFYWTNEDSTAFNNAMSIPFRRGDSVYVNFHTLDYPDGEVRGQVIRNYRTKNITSAIQPNAKGIKVRIFPNPVSDKVFFQGLRIGNYQVEIFDISGQSKLSKNLSSSELANGLDISTYTNGIYLLKLVKDGKINTMKFVKN